MKKIISLGLIFVFAFGLIGFTAANTPEVGNEDLEDSVKTTGLENAESRINRVMEKIEAMNIEGVNLKGLENALRNIIKNQGEDKECLEVVSGLEFEDEGEDVEVLREVLEELDYYDDDFEDEGSDEYGWGIAKAVYDYQQDNDIETDSDMERLGFKLSEETREGLNEDYECEDEEDEEEEEEDEEDEDDEDLNEKCEVDDQCEWVSTNCCPENAGANWECLNSEEVDLECEGDEMCPQVISPKPSTPCECEDEECEAEEEEDEDNEEEEEEE
ncbi:MAG: peptidoglycan-binding protein [Patescibacteria group bacterium]